MMALVWTREVALRFQEGGGVSPPYGEVLLFRQKDPKPLTPRLALWEGRDANFLKSGPTRRAQTRSANCEERPSLGPAGRRRNTGPSGDLRGSDLKVGNREDLHIFSVPDDGFRGGGMKRGIKAMIIRRLEDGV